MRGKLWIVLGLALMAGCEMVGSEKPIGTASVVTSEPWEIVDYDPAFQIAVADELLGLPEGSPIAVMIADYAVLRAELRGPVD